MYTLQDRNQWINSRNASRALKVSEMMVYKWAVIGRLRTLVLPGEGVRFSKQDVDRLAIETGVAADPEVQANV